MRMAKSNHMGALSAAAGVLVAMGFLLLVVAVHSQPTEATFPGLPGNIAYAGSDATDTEIFTINANGGTAFKLTNNDTPDSEPSYSPDGKKIAYVGSDGTDEEIYTINATGGSAFKVTGNSTDDGAPSWGSLP